MQSIHFCESLSLSRGGPSHSVSQLCNHIYTKKHRVAVVLRDTETGNSHLLNSAIQRHSLSDVRHSLIDRDSHIIHIHGIWRPFNHQAVRFAHESNIPLVISPRGMLEPWALKYKAWKKKLVWLLYQKRDLQKSAVLHATAYSEAENIRRLGFTQPIAVIPNGVDPIPNNQDNTTSIGTHKRQLLFLSRIHPKKGISLLLQSWAVLNPQDWELIIAGNDDDQYQLKLENQVRNLGIEQSVRFVGPLYGANKDKAYRNADLFVLPSYSENFGIVVAEALQYGVPVITTTGTPWNELITHKCGWWITPDLESLTKALREAMSTLSEVLQQMGKNGQHLIQTKYQWPSIADDMISVYHWILGQGPKPSCVIT